MIWKLLGSLILLFAGGYVSVAITRFERRRLRVLDGYISLIYYVRGQIDCYAMPLDHILASADPAVIATAAERIGKGTKIGVHMFVGFIDRRIHCPLPQRTALRLFQHAEIRRNIQKIGIFTQHSRAECVDS